MGKNMVDSETQLITEDLKAPGRLFLPSLSLARFTMSLPYFVLVLLLIDIGQAFNRSVGEAGQIDTIASLVGVIAAVLMGAWSVRFQHKTLLRWGLACFCISVIGCFFAINFLMMLVFYALTGLGAAMVGPMIYSLIGEHLPVEQRTRAIGWMLAIAAFAAIIGPPITSIIAGIGSWRLPFLVVAFPFALLSLVFATKGLPVPSQIPQSPKSKVTYLEGFKGVFSNR